MTNCVRILGYHDNESALLIFFSAYLPLVSSAVSANGMAVSGLHGDSMLCNKLFIVLDMNEASFPIG